MSVSSTTTKVSASGDASTAGFNYTFKIFADSEMQVIIRASNGVETIKTLSTHYNVSGAGADAGGTVTFTSGNIPASGQTVVLRRNLALTQGTDYVENDPFPAESHEDGLDRLTMIAQGLQEELDRSFKISRTNTITSAEFTDNAATRASKLLGFDSSGNLEATTGRVSSVSVSAVNPGGSPTASFTTASGALALGIVTGATGATGAAGSASAVLTTRGDVLKRGASAVERLAIGSANTVLSTNGTDPAWSTVTNAMLAGSIDLTSKVTGTLPLAQGGIGATSLASAGIAALAADQTFTAANRGTITVDNDLSLDLSVTNNWKVTPSGAGALTFTNHTAGQSGNILLINSGGHAISLHANTKGDANLATTISVAGTYWLSYYDDGTNAYVVTSAVFA